MSWLRTATQYLIPTLCMVCEQAQAEIVCHPCRDRIAYKRLQFGPSCLVCALPIRPHQSLCAQCEQAKPAFDHVTYLDLYQEPLRQALHLLKYQKRLACASGFALLWNVFHQHTLKACDADVLIPVPLSPTKLAARGFNQAWEIAKRFDLDHRADRAGHSHPRIRSDTHLYRTRRGGRQQDRQRTREHARLRTDRRPRDHGHQHPRLSDHA